MDMALLGLRLVLAAVFLVAGIAKLFDLQGSRQALRDFGVPAALAGPSGLVLPLAEVLVALALLPSLSAWWAAAAALALLLLFIAGISSALLQGRAPDCHCFGQVHSAPAGPWTLIRNLVLAALAGCILWFGRGRVGLDPWSWWGIFPPGILIELLGGLVILVLLIGTWWLLWHVLRQQGQLLLRLETVEARLLPSGQVLVTSGSTAAGLAVGEPAPPFSLPGLHGETLTLESLRARGKPVLLFFASPTCGPCEAMFPEISRLQDGYEQKLTVAVISSGSKEANQNKVAVHGMKRVLLQKKQEVQTAYQVTGTPALVLIRPDGTIGSRLAQGADAIRVLIDNTTGLPMLASNGHGTQTPSPSRLEMGDQAPDFRLPDLEGKQVKLSEFRGSPTLLLFWRPGCGFCQRMLPDLKAWEEQQREGQGPHLVVVSSESVESNRAMGLRSVVLLDPSGTQTSRQFGATGTPMAVLVDEAGKIASTLAKGAPEVLHLAQTQMEKPMPG